MKCEKCGKSINPGQEYDHFDKLLCEDCYMDALSPARTCDPWAVHSAKSLAKAGDGLSHQVTRIQEEILGILVAHLEQIKSDPLFAQSPEAQN